MSRRKVDLKKVFIPSDSIAFIVIIVGLFIALFLDEMAVRLIGVCIAVLGGVALFMMVSPRLTEVSMQRPPRPTESPLFMSQTTSDGGKTSQVFDSQAYRETFGATEGGGQIQLDDLQIGLFPDLPEKTFAPRLTHTSEPPPRNDAPELEFSDGQSTVRVVGVRSSRGQSAAPKLAIESRTQRAHMQQEQAKSVRLATDQNVAATKSPDLVITGKVTDEVQISDDVVVRPLGSATASAATADPTEGVESQARIQPVPAPTAQSLVSNVESSAQPPRSEISVSVFMADDDEEMEPSEEPRKEFDYLLNRVLKVIRSATSARTAAFFWFNRDRQQLVLEARVTDAEQFTNERKIPIGADVVSRIALEGRPEIVTHITPTAELDVLPYYTSNCGTLSFVGVPVYFQGNVVGVLCADAIEQNAYTDVTVGFFGHFTKLIGGLVLSYTSKYDLQQNSRTLEIIQQFRASVSEAEPSITSVIQCLFDAVIKYMDISTIGVCAFDPQLGVWTIRDAKSVIPEYSQLIGAPIDLTGSVVGECITQGEAIAVSVEGSSIRVTAAEPEIDLCQLVALPMRSLLHTHGALYMENHKGTITNQDVSVAEMLADLAGEMIAGLRESAKSAGADSSENTTTPTVDDVVSFADSLREEVARSADYAVPLTLCYIKVDDLVGTGTEEKSAVLELIMTQIMSRIREQVREYDIVDQVEADTLGVALVAYNAHEAQFWTESLRRDVANTPIEAGGRQWSATVSVGVAQLEAGDTWQLLIENAQRALSLSTKAKNKVTVYS